MRSGDVRVVLMTAPDEQVARKIVRTLVEEALIACGNIVPRVHSIYRWQGAIEEASEVLVILKTTAASFARLESRVLELHPYDVPELLSLRVEQGHERYLSWVIDGTEESKQ